MVQLETERQKDISSLHHMEELQSRAEQGEEMLPSHTEQQQETSEFQVCWKKQ